ncbi:MAG: hypothetical protein ABT11_20585 [Novosphingobium sp. SCN 66-18]|nr:MAG: hypothetical protein ABT11_20585 [Novosphingobium sp. SCN 66-18]
MHLPIDQIILGYDSLGQWRQRDRCHRMMKQDAVLVLVRLEVYATIVHVQRGRLTVILGI